MNKSLVDIVEKCKNLLFQVPKLADKLGEKDVQFIPELTNWLQESEEFLKTYNYAQCSEIAGFRSQLMTPLLSSEKNSSKRKEQLYVASTILYPAQSVLHSVLEPIEFKVQQAREIITQLLQLAKQAGMIRYEASIDFNTYIMGIFESFKSHEQLAASMTKVLTMINRSDVLRVMAEEIDFS